MRLLIFASLVLVVLLYCPFASAQVPPQADTFVNSNAQTTNYGSGTLMNLQSTEYCFIGFNLTGVPANATVQKAMLRLFLSAPSSPGPGAFDVYEIDSLWGEKTLTWSNMPPLGSSATGGNPVSLGNTSYQTFVLVDITSLVQKWVNGTVANNGIALALTTKTGSYSFDTKEATGTSHPAELDIVFAGPQGPQGPQGLQGPTGLT